MLLPYIHAEDMENYCNYLVNEHSIPRKVLERQRQIARQIAAHIMIETRIIESLHDLDSLPSKADRTPLLQKLAYPNRLYRYYNPNMKVVHFDQHRSLLSFYGLYESTLFGGTFLLLLPEITDEPDGTYGQLIILTHGRRESMGKFRVANEGGKLCVKRLGCNKAFDVVWNSQTKAHDLRLNDKIVFVRQTPTFKNEE